MQLASNNVNTFVFFSLISCQQAQQVVAVQVSGLWFALETVEHNYHIDLSIKVNVQSHVVVLDNPYAQHVYLK